MNFNVIFLTIDAKIDLFESLNYFNSINKSLASNFYFEIEKNINLLCDNPKIGSKVNEQLRKLVIKKYDFSIYYTIEEEKIIVLAIFHNKRNPSTIFERYENEK